MQTVGRAILTGSTWEINLQPHAAMMFRRVFSGYRANDPRTVYHLPHTPANCFELQWFAQRFPLQISPADKLGRMAAAHVGDVEGMQAILADNYTPQARGLAVPLRRYQGVAVDLYLLRERLLNADDVGLGKTATAIGALADPRTLPAIVVTLPNLCNQWKAEIEKFLPGTRVAIAKKSTPHWVGNVDVLITTYAKLAGWRETLSRPNAFRSIAFDEIQELRRNESDKYNAAKQIADRMAYRMGLSATPIFNHGGEIFNIFEVLAPGSLGTVDEFCTAHCTAYGSDRSKWRLTDPVGFGSFLRAEGLMIRRTREMVGRELPPVSKFTQQVDADPKALDANRGRANMLAKIILGRAQAQSSAERLQAAGEFDALMRKITGIAKANAVADFVRIMAESGEPVVLAGYHHAVYDIWRERFKDLGAVFFTGQETQVQREAAKKAFIEGRAPILVLALRSGVGLDGLQYSKCRTVVFGEFDWSPAIHTQFIGRVCRDGQRQNVFVYFCASDFGTDPTMIDVLGVKREQSEGLTNLRKGGDEILSEPAAEHIKRLAADYLKGA